MHSKSCILRGLWQCSCQNCCSVVECTHECSCPRKEQCQLMARWMPCLHHDIHLQYSPWAGHTNTCRLPHSIKAGQEMKHQTSAVNDGCISSAAALRSYLQLKACLPLFFSNVALSCSQVLEALGRQRGCPTGGSQGTAFLQVGRGYVQGAMPSPVSFCLGRADGSSVRLGIAEIVREPVPQL